jgi:hypothetical protein
MNKTPVLAVLPSISVTLPSFMDRDDRKMPEIDNLWQGSKPLAKLFRTETKGYLYDIGTNKIPAIGEIEFDLLNRFLTKETGPALKRAQDLIALLELASCMGGGQKTT